MGQFITKFTTFMPLLSLIVIFLMTASVFMQLYIHGLIFQNKSFLLTHALCLEVINCWLIRYIQMVVRFNYTYLASWM